jgi:hypothetical protein
VNHCIRATTAGHVPHLFACAAMAISTLFATACKDIPSITNADSQVTIFSTGIIEGGVFAGDTIQLVAQAHNASGTVLGGTITWSSSVPTVATVSGTGLVTAVGGGTTTITATYGTSTDFKVLTVDNNVSSVILISPATATTRLGAPFQFSAIIRTSLGNLRRGAGPVWSATDATKVTVDASGKATPVAVTAGTPVCATAPDVATVKVCGTLTITP